MRASKRIQTKEVHISGAERIVQAKNINFVQKILVNRALIHENGCPDFINLKIEEINEKNILKLKALPVKKIEVDSCQKGYEVLIEELIKNGISAPHKILNFLKKTSIMRGAMLLDINHFRRLEPDWERGIRATGMDSDVLCIEKGKNHFREAIVLATKIANAPHIVGEICISDDINYTTGYFASKKSGYVRITKLKEIGDPFGGRIFLYNGKGEQDLKDTIDFIEKKCVIVTHVPQNQINQKDKYQFIINNLQHLKENNLHRTESSISSINRNMIEIEGKKYLNFSSNNYLGFGCLPKIKIDSKNAIDQFGIGTGASRLITGTLSIHRQLEEMIADFKNCEDAIVFNSGYCANVATLSALFEEEDVIFSDELNHASIVDGCRLSKAKTIVYKHNDIQDLEDKIKRVSFRRGVIVSDAVFSMDGDIANLPELLKLAEKYNLFSYLDEAHSTGVLGEYGHGLVEYYHLDKAPDILMGTLSKAIGTEGGFIAGKKILIEYLKNVARSYVFSTAIVPASIAAAIKGFELLKNNNSYVKNLQKNIDFFNLKLKKLNLGFQSKTPIFCIPIGEESKTLNIAQKFLDKGFFVKAIRYPSVKKGEARIRIVINAMHTHQDLENLANNIANVLK